MGAIQSTDIVGIILDSAVERGCRVQLLAAYTAQSTH